MADWRWSRRAAVQESSGGAGERRWSRRAAVEESSVGEESCVGRERRRGSCITQFRCIFLISLPHFDLWGWACYEMALAFAAWKSPGKKEHATVTKLTAISKPKTIIISLGPFEYLWLFKKNINSYFSIWVSRINFPREDCTLKVLLARSGHLFI